MQKEKASLLTENIVDHVFMELPEEDKQRLGMTHKGNRVLLMTEAGVKKFLSESDLGHIGKGISNTFGGEGSDDKHPRNTNRQSQVKSYDMRQAIGAITPKWVYARWDSRTDIKPFNRGTTFWYIPICSDEELAEAVGTVEFDTGAKRIDVNANPPPRTWEQMQADAAAKAAAQAAKDAAAQPAQPAKAVAQGGGAPIHTISEVRARADAQADKALG